MTAYFPVPGIPAVVTVPAAYTEFLSGEFLASGTLLQLPANECKLVRFKGKSTNSGSIYLGPSGVTAMAGASSTTAGFEIDAGDDTGWMTARDLSDFWVIGDNSADSISYLIWN